MSFGSLFSINSLIHALGTSLQESYNKSRLSWWHSYIERSEWQRYCSLNFQVQLCAFSIWLQWEWMGDTKCNNVIHAEKNLHNWLFSLNWVRPQTVNLNPNYANSQPNVIISKVIGLCVTEMKLDTVIPTSPWSHICALSMSIFLRSFVCLLVCFSVFKFELLEDYEVPVGEWCGEWATRNRAVWWTKRQEKA